MKPGSPFTTLFTVTYLKRNTDYYCLVSAIFVSFLTLVYLILILHLLNYTSLQSKL